MGTELKSDAESKSRGIQSVEISGRLLKVLVEANHPMKLKDLAEQAGLTPGQAHAYVVSLRKIELVTQDPATSLYWLGPFALHLGFARLRAQDPVRIVTEEVPTLREELDLMVATTIWGQSGPTIIRVDDASHQVHANVRAGATFSITGTATGKVFGAYLSSNQVEPMIAAELRNVHQWAVGQKPTLASTHAEIEETRRLGYAVTEGIPIPGLNAISAPVFDHSRQLQLALTIIGPSAVLDCSPSSPQVGALLEFARRMSYKLGYPGE